MNHEATGREIVACHEAGHAVLTWSLKVKLCRIHVGAFEGKVTGGTACLDFFNPDSMSASDWTKVKNKALILLAGELAEVAYHELHENYIDEYLSEHDRREFAELLERFGEHECPPIDMSEKTLRVEADKLVVKHWN